MDELIITVRDNQQTFTAACNGVKASSTAGALLAAYRCALKIFEGDAELTQLPDERRNHTTWKAIPKDKK